MPTNIRAFTVRYKNTAMVIMHYMKPLLPLPPQIHTNKYFHRKQNIFQIKYIVDLKDTVQNTNKVSF